MTIEEQSCTKYDVTRYELKKANGEKKTLKPSQEEALKKDEDLLK
jgi:hypothetical protein